MAADSVLKQNDLLPAITVVCADEVGPVDLTGATALFRMVNVRTGAVKVNAAATVLADPIFTATGATLTSNDHRLNTGDAVTLKSTTALPGGLSTSITYYVVNVTPNTLQLALKPGGAPITTTSAGTGVHTLLAGKVRYEWQGTDTDTPGTYFGEVQTIVGGQPLTYPNDRNLVIEVISDLV